MKVDGTTIFMFLNRHAALLCNININTKMRRHGAHEMNVFFPEGTCLFCGVVLGNIPVAHQGEIKLIRSNVFQ